MLGYFLDGYIRFCVMAKSIKQAIMSGDECYVKKYLNQVSYMCPNDCFALLHLENS